MAYDVTRRKKIDRYEDRERMSAAMLRLEDLLRDPGAAASAKALKVARSGRIGRRVETAQTGISEAGEPDRAFSSPEDFLDAAQIDDADDIETHAAVEPLPRQSRQRHVWTSKAEAGPKAPPPRPQRAAPALQKPATAKPRANAEPPRAKLIDALLAPLIGHCDSDIKSAVASSRRAIRALIGFSAVIAVVMLTGPITVMLIIDSVLPSASTQMLTVLACATAALAAIIGLVEFARSRIVSRVGAEIEMRLSGHVFASTQRASLSTENDHATPSGAAAFRHFVSGPAPMAVLDAVWSPIPFAALFVVDWRLGATSLLGSVIIVAVAVFGDRSAQSLLNEADGANAGVAEIAGAVLRSGDDIAAMGFLSDCRRRWQALYAESVSWNLLASDRIAGAAIAVKTTRLLIQAMVLALAAYFALGQEISPGAAIAAAVLANLALAPLEKIVCHWRAFVAARAYFANLESLAADADQDSARVSALRPRGALEAQALRVAGPESRAVILSGVSFTLAPGQSLAIVGPNGSGKSALARTIAGLHAPLSGAILLDGVRLGERRPGSLGRHVGYLPQNVELLPGSVAANIGRFQKGATHSDIIAAAKLADAHDAIVALPRGYDSDLGTGGVYVSAGQRQRIALARALFGAPAIVVLDEPSANLDKSGLDALLETLAIIQNRGQTVILATSIADVIVAADFALILDAGRQRAFGPREEVLASSDDAARPAVAARQ